MKSYLSDKENEELQKMIRERFEKDPESFDDGNLAADANIANLAPGKTISSIMVMQRRVKMRLKLVKSKRRSLKKILQRPSVGAPTITINKKSTDSVDDLIDQTIEALEETRGRIEEKIEALKKVRGL